MPTYEYGLPGTDDVFDQLVQSVGEDAIGAAIMEAVSDSPVHAYQFTTKMKLEAFLTEEGWKAVAIPFR